MAKIPIWEAVHRDLCQIASEPDQDAANRRTSAAMRDGIGSIVPLLNNVQRDEAMRCVELMFALVLMNAREEEKDNVITAFLEESVRISRTLFDMCDAA